MTHVFALQFPISSVLAIVTTLFVAIASWFHITRKRPVKVQEHVQESQEPVFWRITGVTEPETAALLALLQNRKDEDEFNEEEQIKLNFARHMRDTLCVIVTCPSSFTFPPVLQDHDWYWDRDFLGITPLSAPEEAEVDVVAVPGLGGHALGSFRSKNGWNVWLRDFLPLDVPTARVLVYGYDTNITSSMSNASIGDLANIFLDSLNSFRQLTQTTRRPIIFVGHDLGGLLIKEAIANASRHSGLDSSISAYDLYLSTYSLIFYGVPNLGLRHEQLLTIVGDLPNQVLIRDLVTRSDSEPSSYLSALTDKFAEMCQENASCRFEIISYYERKFSHTVKMLPNGELSWSGTPTLLVTKYSAERISDRVRDIEHIPMEKDHEGMVRFECQGDDNYGSVMVKIATHAHDAPQIVAQRFAEVEATRLTSEQSLVRSTVSMPPSPTIRNTDYIAEPESEAGASIWLISPSVSDNGEFQEKDDPKAAA